VLVRSTLVLPAEDSTMAEVRHLFDRDAGADGLVPG
jgi:hypothetical protein